MRKIGFILVLLAALAVSTNANAGPILTLTSGATTVTIQDNQAGDANSALGLITFVGAVGAWNLNTTTGTTVGASPVHAMDLNSIDSLAAAPLADLTITWTDDTLYTWPGATLSIGGTMQNGAAATITYNAYWDSTSNLIASLTFTEPSSGPFAFSGQTSGFIGTLTGVNFIQRVTIHPTDIGQTSFDAQLNAVPEPTSMILLGSGLIGVAAAVRRRIKK